MQSRTQLLRMTSEGLLVNIGIEKPENGAGSTEKGTSGIVLDILNACDPQNPVPLMLRRVDHRRKLTQQWTFTEVGFPENKSVCM